MQKLDLISEYNDLGVLLPFAALPGAYTRGATEEV